MLKTISVALLAVSVLAAPALAAGTDKTAQAPVTQAPVTKSAPAKQPAVNANAKMGRHHVKHAIHHRAHKKMTTSKLHKAPKIATKHVTQPAKHG